MPLPRIVARFNKRFTNRLIEPVVRRSSGFAVIHHVGRSSGRQYRTPVNVFDADGRFLVALTYGPQADWIRNVQAGNATVERGGEISAVDRVELIDRTRAWPHLPLMVTWVLRVLAVRDFALLSVANSDALV